MPEGRLLMVCGEPVGERMAGPAIRAVELAGAIAAAGFDVTLAAPRGAGQAPLANSVELVSLSSLKAALRRSDAAVVGAGLLTRFPALLDSDLPLAIDLYDPVAMEAAELYRRAPRSVLRASIAEARATNRLELERADLVLCASRRQRQLWTNALAELGRGDDILRVVPFGVPSGRPQRQSGALRGVVPGIEWDDQLVLWAGGLHDWFDPELAAVAVARLASLMPRLRLVFLGANPPNARLQGHSAGEAARRASDSLGVTGRSVFFLSGWVPYQQRGAFLADADVGISTHRESEEARYAWRTRILDYLWAGLPVACTAGDALGDLVAERGAGISVPPGDVEALAIAIRRLVEPGPPRDTAGAASLRLADEFRWPDVAEPLIDWLRAPRRTGGRPSRWPATAALWTMFAAKGWHTLRTEGAAAVRRRSRRLTDSGS